jgi:septal ring factor EnvC (AmiA/AmiB activator)
MTIDEKIAVLTEKAAAKRQKLANITESIERRKNTAKVLNSEIEALAKNIFDLEAERLFAVLKEKEISVAEIVEAVSAGIFDSNSAENCAINNTENIMQEEMTDEIDSSGKTVGNA